MGFLPAKQFEIRILNTMYDNHVYDLQNYNFYQPKKQNDLFLQIDLLCKYLQ